MHESVDSIADLEGYDGGAITTIPMDAPLSTGLWFREACLRCPQLHIDPKMQPRLDELEADLEDQRKRATAEGWVGEIEGLDRTLHCLRDKRANAMSAG